MKLNVGCGDRELEGYDGLDIVDFGQKFVMDVRKELPWANVQETVGGSESYTRWEQIRANHFLEHLTNDEAVKFLNGCHLKCDELYIEVPHKDSEGAWDITHKSYYNERTFRGFEREDRERYGIKRWKITKIVVKKSKNIFVWMRPV